MNYKNLSKLIIFISFLTFYLFKPDNVFAGCSPVASNKTTCDDPAIPIACMQPTPVAGNINRWCCDTQDSCDQTKSGVQQAISTQLATGSSSKAFPEIKLPCDQTRDVEFHSLRPYQAAQCGDSNKAYFCSNDLIFIESFNVKGMGDCTPRGEDGDFTCHPDAQVEPHTLYVQLDNSMLPILGNTEQVTNTQGGTEVFDDATKLNEYASWYLSGVNGRAEYPNVTNDQIINFSGPLKKLYPSVLQDFERNKTITDSSANVTYTDEDTGKSVTEPQNHDQIVVCESGDKAVQCPQGKGLRLSDWGEGHLSTLNFLLNLIPGVDKWNNKFPPLPWQFDTQIKYQKAYQEWKGKVCVILPIVGLQCADPKIGDIDIVPNKWSELYQYVPMSSTADKKGAEWIKDVQFRATNGTAISCDKCHGDEIVPAALWMAHTEEVMQLAQTLNKTYTPKDVKSVPSTSTVEPALCSVLNVRTNQGDNLFPGDPLELQIPDVTYHIDEAECHERIKLRCNDGSKPNADPACTCPNKCEESSLDCHAQVYITIKTGTKTPNAKVIFRDTVASSGSTFRKIFPKVGPGAPVECIANIPTVTNVTYTTEGLNALPQIEGGDTGTQEFKVKKIPEDSAGDTPELTFPHIGSIYEYFLKGIQTALRPKGYGEPIVNGTLCTNTDSGDCSFDIAKINSAIQKAASKYKVPQELLKSVFEIESYEYIANPSSYVCEENFAGAAGVAQIVKSTYDDVTCSNEKMDNDIPMCGDNSPKLSRCNVDDAFELMARILLYKAGRWNSSSCSSSSGIALSEKMVWYNATCNYYGSHNPDDLTRGLQNDIPTSERRPVGDMNYCDIVCQKMGQCPEYPKLDGDITPVI